MRVLLLGASGFIGSEVGQALAQDGHGIVAFARDTARGRRILPDAQWRAGDLRRMTSSQEWAPFLESIDVIVNAAGALQDGLRDGLAEVQDQAIRALAEAAEQVGVSHFVQISAAGAAIGAGPFLETKARADAALAASPLCCTILRPGLVIGRNAFGGTELVRIAAGLPLIAVDPSRGGAIQCVAISDLVAAIRSAIDDPIAGSGTFDLVEAQSRTLGTVVALHRQWLGLPAPRISLRIPIGALRPIGLVADVLGWCGWRSPLRSNALAVLAGGISGEAKESTALLGRAPLSLPETLASLGPAGKADRWHARLGWLYPLALAALFLLWLAGGAIGLLRLGPAADLLIAAGIAPAAARSLAIAGALADLAIALCILFRPTLRPALAAGAALASAYLFAGTLARPDLWLDPLGSMVKIVPAMVLSLVCLALAEER